MSIKGRLRVSAKGIDQHLTADAFSTHNPIFFLFHKLWLVIDFEQTSQDSRFSVQSHGLTTRGTNLTITRGTR